MPQPSQRLLTDAFDLPDDTRTRLALARESLQRSGQLTFRALGSSMLPAIAAGDVLTFRTAAPGDLVPGRIVLAQADNGLVAHRLLSCGGSIFTTRGDSLRVADAALDMSRLLGVLAAHHRDGTALPLDRDHRRLLPRASRWLLRHSPLIHRIARRWPRLTILTA